MGVDLGCRLHSYRMGEALCGKMFLLSNRCHSSVLPGVDQTTHSPCNLLERPHSDLSPRSVQRWMGRLQDLEDTCERFARNRGHQSGQ
jgi:hypothetical protein